jgi:hypothetical protein
MNLEQKCVRPGNWWIEGYNVRRHHRRTYIPWKIYHFEEKVHEAQTLADARVWIANQPGVNCDYVGR